MMECVRRSIEDTATMLRLQAMTGGVLAVAPRGVSPLEAVRPYLDAAGPMTVSAAQLFPMGVAVPAAPRPPFRAQSSDGNHGASAQAGCCIQTDCIQCASRVLPEG